MAIDDEALALRRVSLLLEAIPDAELIATSQDPLDAYAKIAELEPDLLLLDIQMAGLGGIELAEQLLANGGHLPFIIFVTAYHNHAVRAFEAQAIDYVLKPLRADRLLAALDRARYLVDGQKAARRAEALLQVVHDLRQQMQSPDMAGDDQELWAQRGSDYVRLQIDEIEWIEAERDYVHIHAHGRAYLLRATMTALHDRLGHQLFMRVHRSAIVRLDRVASIRDRGYGHVDVVLQSGARIRVGRTYLKPLRERLRGSTLTS